MALYIKIRKEGLKNNIHLYHVQHPNGDKKPFYLGINPEENIIYYYEDPEMKALLGSIDLSDENASLRIPTLHPVMIGRSLSMALKAIEKNQYPNVLDYAA